jgi:hypothetical protein
VPPYDTLTRNDGAMFDYGDVDDYDIDDYYDTSESDNQPSVLYSQVYLGCPSPRAKKKFFLTVSNDLADDDEEGSFQKSRKVRKIDVTMRLEHDTSDSSTKREQHWRTSQHDEQATTTTWAADASTDDSNNNNNGMKNPATATTSDRSAHNMIAVDLSETSLYIKHGSVLSMVSFGKMTYRSYIKRIAVSKQQGSVRMLLEL